MLTNTTLPLADVTKLEGTQINDYILSNTNLLLVNKKPDDTKEIIQFNLKRQVLDKITEVDARLGVLTHLDVNDNEVYPEAGSVCELVEKNQENIRQILDTIGSAQSDAENPNGTGMQQEINLLKTDTTSLKNTHFHKGRQIELINARQTSTRAFTEGETITCSLNTIPNLNISSNIKDFKEYSYDLEVSLLVKMDNNSLNTKINNKYVIVTTVFNLNSLYFSSDNKLGIITLPFGDTIFVKFTINNQVISFQNVFMTNMANYKREDIKINNVVLHINEIESLVVNTTE